MEAGSAQHPAPRRGISAATGAATVLGVAAAIFAEALIAALVALTHPGVAFVVLTVACSAISMLIAFAFDAETDDELRHPVVARVQAWIARHRETAASKFGRLVELSEGLAFVLLSVTAGPFITTLAMKLRGIRPGSTCPLCIATSALFSACWVAIYSGAFAALGLLIDRLA